MKEIEVKFKENLIKGILIKEDNEHYHIKLSNGYNSILKKDNVKVLKIEEINEKRNNLINNIDSNSKPKSKPKLKIKLLHTGGTIASKVDYSTGAVSSKFTPEEILNLYSDLLNKADIDVELVGNLFSEDFRFSHYNLLLKKIKDSINENFDGIIISHGTDTMHYTSAALQYSLKNLSIPVILVGAQRSSDRPSSDAYSNLSASIDFINYNKNSKKKFLRVGICMHETISDNSFLILDSINVKKLHSTRRDAFKQINYNPFARIEKSKIQILRKELLSSNINNSNNKKNENKKDNENNISYTPYDEKLKIGFFKPHPNLFPEEIKQLSLYDGIIIEGTGLGHLAINEIDNSTKIHLKNYDELKKISQKIPIIMGVQTIFGQTNLNVYSTGRKLQELKILGNYMNLTTETLFIRLAYCLSKDKSNFTKIWDSNLEGFKIRSNEL